MTKLPYVSPELVRTLERMFPDKVPRKVAIGTEAQALSVLIGQQSVLDKLREALKRQEEENT